jgi:hypothetical protein
MQLYKNVIFIFIQKQKYKGDCLQWCNIHTKSLILWRGEGGRQHGEFTLLIFP